MIRDRTPHWPRGIRWTKQMCSRCGLVCTASEDVEKEEAVCGTCSTPGRFETVPGLRQARLAAGMSQGDLAYAIGLGRPSSICDWERGRKRPSAERLMQVADVLGVSVEELTR